MTQPTLLESARRIAPLAWPMYVGQVAVLAFGTVDTVMVARHSALDLAALAIGGAAYVSVFIGLMGVVMALGPIAGHLYGGGRLEDAGRALHQATWLGLGLSTAHGIVKQSGGEMVLESEVGRGTRLTIYLPRAASLDRAAAGPDGGRTVLLVEDDGSARALLREILERDGFEVLEAEDGLAALEAGSRYVWAR